MTDFSKLLLLTGLASLAAPALAQVPGVGIGLNNPQAQLHLYNPGATYVPLFQPNSAAAHKGYGELMFGNGGVTKAAAIQVIDDGSFGGGFYFNVHSASGSDNWPANTINALAIRATGNVGIGTTTPGQRLSVAGGIHAAANGSFTGNAGLDQGTHLQWNRSGDSGETWLINHMGGGTVNAGIRFGGITTPTGTTVTEWARFNNNGNFGIGTGSPSQKLEVAGGIKFTGAGNVLTFPDGSTQSTAATTAATTTASNGLTKTGNDVALGGPLTSSTNIALGNNNLTLSGTGSVGIGTTTPTATLDVNGSTRLRGLTVAGLVATDANGNLSSSGATGNSFLNNTTTQQTANFNVSGTGIVGGMLTAGSVQVGTGAVGTTPAMAGTLGGTATTTATTAGPFNGGTNSSQVGAFYTASQLTAAGLVAGQPISTLAWNVTNKVSTGPFLNFSIQLANVTTAPTTSTLPTGRTTVYSSGSVTTTAGVNTFPLSTSFTWDGTSGLYVLTCFTNTSNVGADAVDAISASGVLRRTTGTSSQCGSTNGTSTSALPLLRFTQAAVATAYTLPTTSGTAGQVLTQQSSGNVAFADPQWVQSGSNLYPKQLSSNVGIGTNSPSEALEVNGNIKISGTSLIFPDNSVQSTAATTYGGADFIQNRTTQQSSANFNISGAGTVGGLLTVGGGLGLTGNLTMTGNATISGHTTTYDVQAVTNSAVSAQGAYLQWNRSGGEGESWLINSVGGGNTTTTGIRFGGVTTNGGTTPTEWARFSNNGNFGIGTSATPAAKLEVNGYTKLDGANASAAPSIAYAKLTGTTPTAANSQVLVALPTGVTGNKVLSVSGMVAAAAASSGTNYIPPNNNIVLIAGAKTSYQLYVYNNSVVINTDSNSDVVFNKPITIFITYEQ